MDLIAKLFEVLFPVFLIIGIGYWYGKKDPKFDTKFITTFAGNFGLPAIIFYSLTSTNISMELFLRFSYYITLYVLIFAAIGIIILKILKKDIYRLLPPLILLSKEKQKELWVEAVEKIKESKRLLDLEIITRKEYEKISRRLKKIILKK